MKWSAEQVLSFAPDAGTEKRGKALAREKKWPQLACNEQAVWGQCKGSGSQPYLTGIDLREPAFKCNCPSRKFPCKHALGLFHLFVQNPQAFQHEQPPAWMEQWLSKRQAPPAPKIKAKDAKAEKAKQKRWEERLALMEDGLQELERWLEDLISQGLGQPALGRADFWEGIAARMVDAKLPRLGSRLREMRNAVLYRDNWQEELLEGIGYCYLHIKAFQQREQLDAVAQEALYSSLGRNLRKADVLHEQESLSDHWWVVGMEHGLDVEDRRFRKTWLLGEQSEKYALILDFAFGQEPYAEQYRLGECIAAPLVYYPSSFPQRALLKQQQRQAITELPQLPAYPTSTAMLNAYGQALAQQPWLEEWPALMENLRPSSNGQKVLIDEEGRALPFQMMYVNTYWQLLSLAARQPLRLFGTWNGKKFRVLMAEEAGQWWPF